MPSKNRKHFAVIMDGVVIDVKSSDIKTYRSCVLVEVPTAGSYTVHWSELEPRELDETKGADIGAKLAKNNGGYAQAVEVVQTAQRLDVGQSLIEFEGLGYEAVEPETTPDIESNETTAAEEYESGLREVVETLNAEYETEQAKMAEFIDQANQDVAELAREADVPAELLPEPHERSGHVRPAYAVGQKYRKRSDAGVVARVFLVEKDGRALAYGNRRNLKRVEIDESWELIQ
jgi:hypothetical protein